VFNLVAMEKILSNLNELKIIIRCIILAGENTLKVDEVWVQVEQILGEGYINRLKKFGYKTVFDYFKSIPDVVKV